MKLVLVIERKETYSFAFDLLDHGVSQFWWQDGKSPSVPETAYVSAKVDGVPVEEYKRFRLQVAYAPDHRFTSVDFEGNLVFDDKQFDKETRRKEWVRRKELKLFEGAMGTSFLRLIYCIDEEQRDVLVVPFDVRPLEVRRKLMDCMVDEVVLTNPYLVLSEAGGLSKNPIVREWISGDVECSTSSILMEYEEIKTLIRSIEPVLFQIAHSPASEVKMSDEFGPMALARLRKVNRAVLTRLYKRGFSCCQDACREKVLVRRKVCSFDLMAHRVISSFLQSRLLRLREIDIALGKEVREINEALSKFPDRKDVLEGRLRQARKMQREIREKLRPFFLRYLSPDMPWGKTTTVTHALTVGPGIFPMNDVYQKIYVIMREFERKRFWWMARKGMQRIPKYVRGHSEPSTWQKNYSYVYEAWVFVRLMGAFEANGFKMVEEYKRKISKRICDVFLGQIINDPIEASSKSMDLKVDIYYCVEGRKEGRGDVGAEEIFGCDVGGGRSKLTPDFAIVFTNVRKGDANFGRRHCIVLDAKSGQRLAQYAIEQRNKYALEFLCDGERVDQSWLVYSGGAGDDCFAGIEFSMDDVNGKCWDEELLTGDSLSWNRGMRFEEDGIKDFSMKDIGRCGGHIRANAITAAKTNKVFENFVKSEIATVRKQLGLAE